MGFRFQINSYLRGFLNFFGDALLLTIHFLVHFGCPCLLRWSNNVPSATNLARYPNLHSFGLSHDYGLLCTILISNQTPPLWVCMWRYPDLKRNGLKKCLTSRILHSCLYLSSSILPSFAVQHY